MFAGRTSINVRWANINKRSLGEQALAGRLIICPEYEYSLEGSLAARWANTARTAPVLLKMKFFKQSTYNPQTKPLQIYYRHNIRQFGEEFGV
jgi:hypothetical protein